MNDDKLRAPKSSAPPNLEHLLQLYYQPVDGEPQLVRTGMSMKKAADLLGASQHSVKRVLEAYQEGGAEKVRGLSWGSDALQKQFPTAAQVEWLCCEETLKVQVSHSFQARADIMNYTWGTNLQAADITEIFEANGVTNQQFVLRVGHPTPTPAKMLEQQQKIDGARTKVQKLLAAGYEVFQLDACTLSPGSYKPCGYSRVGEPFHVDYKWTWNRHVACYAAISVNEGCAHHTVKHCGKAVNGEDVWAFVQGLRGKLGAHKKMAVYWDNASVHHLAARSAPELGVEVIWNAPYRPDLNGIEFFWARLKSEYRARVTEFRVLNQDWDERQLVKDCVRMVKPCARECAARGWSNLEKAKALPSVEFDPDHGDKIHRVSVAAKEEIL